MKILSKVTVAVAALALVLGTASAASALTYTGTLKVGSRGAAVSSLQTCLNGKGMSAGVADGIFGMGTKAAVMRFQSANSLAVDGIAGMATHAALGNCSTTVVPNDDNNDDNGDVDLNDFIIDGGEEVDLQDFDAKDGDDDSVVEGATSKEIAHFEFTPEDSDFLLERIHFVFAGADGVAQDENTDADGAFEDITLFINGDEIDTIDASDSDNWDDDKYGDRADYGYSDDSTQEVMSLPFKSINEILSEGDEVVVTLEADIPSSVDGSDDGEQWDIYIPADGLRGIDTSGSTSYLGDDSDFASVTIEGEGADNALDITVANDSPDAQTVVVDDSNRTEVTVAKFEIEASDEGEDLQINQINAWADLTAATGTAVTETYATVVYNTVLVIDGEEYDVNTVETTANDCTATGASETALDPCLIWEFDRNEVVIGAGDTVDAEIIMEVNELDDNTTFGAGQIISVDVNSDDMDVEGDDSKEDVTDLGGSVSGDDQSLYFEGISAELGNVTFTETEDNNGAVTKVVFTMPIEVSAFGDSFYIPSGTDRDTIGTNGFNFQIENGNDVVKTEAGAIVDTTTAISSTATGVTGGWRVDAGQTKVFTLNVTIFGDGLAPTVNASWAADYYKVQLLKINYDNDSGFGSLASPLVLTPSQDFETDPRSIDA